MPNIIELNLLENKSIVATMQGYPLGNENSYKIIAGEENSTKFIVKSIPNQYANARLTVEMVNSQGLGIAERELSEIEVDLVSYKGFILPVGMAVAGYGYVSIKAYIGDEVAVFQQLKLKVWNTIPQWQDYVDKTANAKVVDGYLILTENGNEYNLGYVQGDTGAKIISTVFIGQDANGGNVYKQTFDNGITAIFVAPKGEQGVQGATGADGKTPVKGVDYFTEADKAEIAAQAAAKVDLSDYAKNPLYGKKVSFIGDSICAGNTIESGSSPGGYGKIIADRNNMVYENLAKGGSTITAETYSVSGGGIAKGWICRMVDSMSADADYAIVEGGVNDAWQYTDHGTIEIGQLSDGYNAVLDDTTYYGAFESMLKKLITKFKGKKIGYIAVPKVMGYWDSNQNVPNFYHIALECCAKWGVSVCDLNTIVPPLSLAGSEYTADGTHPTYEGYLKYYCDPIEEWMKTLTSGGNNAAFVALKAIEEYTKGFNDAIKALQDGKLDNTGISFKKALLPLADGTTIEIDVLTAIDGTVIIPYINQVPISIDTDGSVYNGCGYEADKRLSSSGVTKSQSNSYVTGYISANGGDVVRIVGCDWSTTVHAFNYICAYDSNFGFIGSLSTVGGATNLTAHGTNIKGDYVRDADTLDATITLANISNIAYVRVSSCGDNTVGLDMYDIADMIITVNEEIV